MRVHKSLWLSAFGCFVATMLSVSTVYAERIWCGTDTGQPTETTGEDGCMDYVIDYVTICNASGHYMTAEGAIPTSQLQANAGAACTEAQNNAAANPTIGTQFLCAMYCIAQGAACQGSPTIQTSPCSAPAIADIQLSGFLWDVNAGDFMPTGNFGHATATFTQSLVCDCAKVIQGG